MFGARMRPSLTLLVGAAVAIAIWLGELVAGPTEARHFIADFGWTGFGLSAAFASGRALFAPIGRDRGGWAWIFMGAVAWAVGQLFWDLYDIVGLRTAQPTAADLGYLLAAVCWLIGCAVLLAGHQQRLAVYALVLDVSAAVLTIVAGIALYVSDVFSTEMLQDPIAMLAALAFPTVYVAATGAALSMFWVLPPQETRRAHLALLLGIGSSTVAFAFWLPQYINDSFAAGGLLDLFRMFGLFGVAMAGRLNAAEGGHQSAPLVPASAVQFSRMALPGVVAVA